MKTAARGTDAPVGQLHGVEAVVGDQEPRDDPVDDLDASRGQRRPVARGDGLRVREEDDVVRPLPK